MALPASATYCGGCGGVTASDVAVDMRDYAPSVGAGAQPAGAALVDISDGALHVLAASAAAGSTATASAVESVTPTECVCVTVC